MTRRLAAACLWVWLVAGLWASKSAAEDQPRADAPDAESIRAVVARALAPIQKGADGHIEHRACFSCHSQALPLVAMSLARQRGFEIDDGVFDRQVERTRKILVQWAERNPDRARFSGGAADTAGYALLALETGDWKPDETTAAVVDYLLQRDRELGHWRASHNDRPPTEASSLTTTALALRALRKFATEQQREPAAGRIEAAAKWLRETEPRDTEDRVFRLWGLKYAGAEPDEVESAARDLLDTQRDDGGWAQTSEMESDAYATGSALAALHLAGGLEVSDPAYQRGVGFLLGDQRDDGTWRVVSRSANRFQLYFETGFPYEKDQWISIAASSWATAALALACPP